MGVLKKFYRLFAALALIHVLAAAGLIAYLASSGYLTPDRVRAAINVIKNGDAQPVEMDAKQTTTGKARTAAAESDNIAAPDPQAEQIRRLNLERVRTHAQQQLILAKRQLVQVQRDREEFEKMIADHDASREQQSEEARSEAFDKELEIVSQLKPKIALDRLLLLPPDNAARLLMNMETRKAKKVVEAAHKDDGKWMRIMEIQERMRDLSPLNDSDAASGDSDQPGGTS